MMSRCLLVIVLIVGGVQVASAHLNTLEPTQSALVSGTEDGDLVFVSYDLGPILEGGKVTRAILTYSVAVESDQRQTGLICAARSSWIGKESEWWELNEERIEPSDIASFDTSDEGLCTVAVDVSRWVRAWRADTRENHGLVMWIPGGEGGLLPNLLGDGVPRLQIVQRPR